MGCCVGVWNETSVEWPVKQRDAAPQPAKRVRATSVCALCSLKVFFCFVLFFSN